MSYYVRNKNNMVERLEDICLISEDKQFFIGGRSPLSENELWRLIDE